MNSSSINESTLHHFAPLSPMVEESLREASLHALCTEGSFTRANLCKDLGISSGLDAAEAEKLGSAVEYFHLASLLLDDLPCMDDAELRRSKACTHKLYGESTTLLSALGFINRAYWLLWQVFSKYKESIQTEAAKLTNDCLGFEGILDGQAKDINYYYVFNDGHLVQEIAEKKTGSLLKLCLLLPAILSEASRYEKMHLSNLALEWGLSYQIADDLKDLYFGEAASGKTTQRDSQLGRPNMALAIGEAQAAKLLSEKLQGARTRVEALEDTYGTRCEVLQKFQNTLTDKIEPLLKAQSLAG